MSGSQVKTATGLLVCEKIEVLIGIIVDVFGREQKILWQSPVVRDFKGSAISRVCCFSCFVRFVL